MTSEIKPRNEYRLMSLIYAYIISISFLNMLIGIVFNTGGMVINISVVLMIAFINIFQIVRFRIKTKVIFYVSLVVIYYLATDLLSFSTLTNNEFYFYFMLASLFGIYECNYEKVLRYTMYISLLAIPLYSKIFGNAFSVNVASIDMGRSYAMLPVFLSGIIHFFFFRRNGKLFDKICYIIDAFLLMQIVLKGNRGIILSLMITIFSLFIKRWGSDKGSRKITSRMVVVMIAVILFYLNFENILMWADEFLRSINIEAGFITKTLRLLKENDIVNGRGRINDFVIKGIRDSFLWGHGMSTVSYNSGWTIVYPHNFILQLFYDGGILLAIPILKILYDAMKIAYTDISSRERSAFFLYMLLICVPKMLFSSDMWTNPAFWLMMTHTLQFFPRKTVEADEEKYDDD